jgi:hypothetical protein
VTWTSLLANKKAQKHKTSKKELDNMRALIAATSSNFSELEANASAHLDLPVASRFLLRRASTQCSETIWP